MSDQLLSGDRPQRPGAVPHPFRTEHGEKGRRVEEIHELAYGPDGRTPRAERWVRRTTIERDPKAGLVRSAAGAVCAFVLQIALAMGALALSLRVLATQPAWMAAFVAAGSAGAVFGIPVLIDHAPGEAKRAVGALVLLLVTVVSLLYLGTMWSRLCRRGCGRRVGRAARPLAPLTRRLR